MHTSQLIGLLKILDKQELKSLGKYLKSDYHNTKQTDKVIQLFGCLIKYHPDYPEAQMNRAKVHYQLFKKEEKSNLTLNKLTYWLKQLIEDFLIMLEQKQQPYLQEQILLQSLKRRNYPTFPKRSKKLIKTIIQNSQLPLNTNDHLQLFELNYAQWSDINTEKIDAKSTQLQESSRQLDAYYFLNKLKIILENESLKNITSEGYIIQEKQEILNLTKQFLKQNNILTLKLVLQAIELLHSSNEQDYFDLKQTLSNSINLLTKQDARDIWLALNNYYINHSSKKEYFSLDEGFQLYHFGEQNDLLIENNRIRDTEYTNAALFGFSSKNDNWTLIFIEQFKPYLAIEKRAAVYAYVKAFYFFQQQAFDVVTDLLFPIEDDEKQTLNIHVRIRSLNVRARFEIWEQDNYPHKDISFLDSQFYNFERYIERNKVLAAKKKLIYLKFAKYLRKILKTKEPISLQVTKLKKIKNELKTMNSINLYEWLEIKVDKMIEYLSPKKR